MLTMKNTAANGRAHPAHVQPHASQATATRPQTITAAMPSCTSPATRYFGETRFQAIPGRSMRGSVDSAEAVESDASPSGPAVVIATSSS